MKPATLVFLRGPIQAFLLILIAVMSLAYSPTAGAAAFTAATEAELVSAIHAANADAFGEHTITLAADITLTAPLPALDNPSADGIILDGAGHTLDGAGTGTVLVIALQTRATFRNLTITGGNGSSGLDGQSGGGIFNHGDLLVKDAMISGNTATNGGGIFNYAGEDGTADLMLSGVIIQDNSAANSGGGIANTGDFGTATVTIEGSVIAGNNAVFYGGGISSNGLGTTGEAIVSVARSTVAGNMADIGGGISNNGNGGTAAVSVATSALTANMAGTGGGAVYNNGNEGKATLVVTNTTISGNEAVKTGGGIANVDNGGDASTALTFVTLAANGSRSGGAIHNTSASSVTLMNSIIAAGTSGKACANSGAMTLVSKGYNLDNDGSCNLNQATDVDDGLPSLLPLALNAPGGTQTHSLGPNSDAHRRIPSGTNGCGTLYATDQRGAPRPAAGTRCDIGAFESDIAAELVCNPPYTPATETALNEAITCVNAAGAGTHTITLAADINLTGQTTPLDNPNATELRVAGAGHTIDGQGNGTVFTIEPGTRARIRDITITGGAGSSGPGGKWGGGVFNRGTLTIEDATLTGNNAANGGGIVNRGDAAAAELTIVRSTINNNEATESGGGIHNSAVGGGSALLNLVNSTVSGNSAGVAGGGLYAEGDGGNTAANLVYATLAFNTSGGNGGDGLHTFAPSGNATVTLAATIVANAPGGGPACARPSGNIISTGYNLAADSTCNLTQGSDLPATNPMLQPLSHNAPGKTATHALPNGSPAANRVPGGAAGCGTAITTDQRGVIRPLPAGGLCDSGAYERQPEGALNYVIFLPVGLR